MATKQIFFYATNSDLNEVISNLESTSNIKYYKSGLLSNSETQPYISLLDEKPGITKAGDNNQCASYLIIKADEEIVFRKVVQNNGEEKIAIDQMKNPCSVYFRPGGIFNPEMGIIEGKVGIISNDAKALELFKLISTEFKSKFLKFKGYMVGRNALECYRNGWRLTQNTNSPKDYDLKLDM